MLTRRTFLRQTAAAVAIASAVPSLSAGALLPAPVILSLDDTDFWLQSYGLVQKDGVRFRTVGPGFVRRDHVMLALARHDPQTAHYPEMTLTRLDYDRLFEIDMQRAEYRTVRQGALAVRLWYDAPDGYPRGKPASLCYGGVGAWAPAAEDRVRNLYRYLVDAGRLPASYLAGRFVEDRESRYVNSGSWKAV